MSSRIPGVWRPGPDVYGPRRWRKPCAYEAYSPDLLDDITVQISGDLAADIVDVERELDVTRITGVSSSAAYAALAQAQKAGIVAVVGPSARSRLFEARDVFQIVTDYERSTATGSGDTRVERTRRRVPCRT